MSEEEKCCYTRVLNRLKMLDEQICKMQTTIKKVREIMRKDLEERVANNGEGVSSPEQVRMASMEIMKEDPKGEEK